MLKWFSVPLTSHGATMPPFGGYRKPAPATTILRDPLHIYRSSSMSRTAADYMAQALAQAGVERVYGVIGDSARSMSSPPSPESEPDALATQ